MYFDFRRFFRAIFLSFFRWRESPAPFDAKRVAFLVSFTIGYSLVEVFNRFCFLLDDWLYPEWKQVKLKPPVFIVGNPRSGTTFTHRVMAKDQEQFFYFKAWEIFFPAIVQKKALSLLGRIDARFGSPLERMIRRIESRTFDDFNKMHRLSAFEPEEDDKLSLHIFSSLDLLWFFPFKELTVGFAHFDEMLSDTEQNRIMGFYKDCIRRQAFFKGSSGRLLSKNPVCPPKVNSLLNHFPGCQFIYPIRNPLEVVPSMVNMAHEMWKATIRIPDGFPMQEDVYETIKYFYTYPLARFRSLPEHTYAVIRYEDLISHPKKTIEDLYERLGWSVSEAFSRILRQEEEKARQYRSEHLYSLEALKISKERILTDLGDIFLTYGFNTTFSGLNPIHIPKLGLEK